MYVYKQVGREYKVMKALHSVGFPVPRVLAHCTDDRVIGTEFFLMDFMKVRICLKWQCSLYTRLLYRIVPVVITFV